MARVKIVNKTISPGEYRAVFYPRNALEHQFDLVVEVLDTIPAGTVQDLPEAVAD